MRHYYRCTLCGLRIAGRVHADGTIHASEQPPSTDAEKPCVCTSCQQQAETLTAAEHRGRAQALFEAAKRDVLHHRATRRSRTLRWARDSLALAIYHRNAATLGAEP